MNEKIATPPKKKAALEKIRVDFKGISARQQCARLLEALASWPISTFEGMRYLDVYHMPARVLQLRKQGFKISMHWQMVETECGVLHRIGVYVLESGVRHV